MNHRQKPLFSACLIALAALFSMAPIQGAWAQTAPDLGTASGFAALGGSGVTCTSPFPVFPVTVTGNVGSGLDALSSVTGFPGFTPGSLPCSLTGTVQLGQTAAIDDFITAYNALASNAEVDGYVCPSVNASHNLVGNLLSGSQGSTLEPGVYCINGVGTLTGQLTLDGGGDSNAVWIFKAASSITTGTNGPGSVVMAGGGNACNVYWQTGTAVDLLNTDFLGNILAGSAITFSGVGSSLVGRALAQTDVTMTGANIRGCEAQPPGPPSCDRNHKHHKHCKHNEHDKPHCDGDDGDHDNGDHDKGDRDKGDHDKGDRDKGDHDKDGRDNDGRDNGGRDNGGRDKDGRGGH